MKKTNLATIGLASLLAILLAGSVKEFVPMRWAYAAEESDSAKSDDKTAKKSADKEDAPPPKLDLGEKMVPILSVGTGLRLGMAQVTGPKRDVNAVKAVAEIEANWKSAARARLYVPVSDANILKGFKRVPRVGVSALADVRLKF